MGGEGVGVFMMKNHEGYHDPTAGKAIRRAHRAKRRGRRVCTSPPLTLIYNIFPHQILNAIPPPPIIEWVIPALLAEGKYFQL